MTDINHLDTEAASASKTDNLDRANGDSRSFVRRDVSLHGSRRENGDAIDGLVSLVERMADISIQEIERVIEELGNVRDRLRNNATRLQGELNNYATTSQAAVDAMKVVGDSLVNWKSQTPKLSQAQQPAEIPRRLSDNP